MIYSIKCVNFKKIANFKKGTGIERYTQFTTVTLIMKKVLKQDEQVNLLCIYMRLQVKMEWSSRVRMKINSKTFTIPILTASG